MIPLPGRPMTGFRNPILGVDADVDDEDPPALEVPPPFPNAAVEPGSGRRRTNPGPIAGARRTMGPLPVPDVLEPAFEPEEDDEDGNGAGPPMRRPSAPNDDDFRCFNSILWCNIMKWVVVAGSFYCPLFRIHNVPESILLSCGRLL